MFLTGLMFKYPNETPCGWFVLKRLRALLPQLSFVSGF